MKHSDVVPDTEKNGTMRRHALSYHIANLQGIGARNRQEDSFGFANAFHVKAMKKEGLLFVVCDGMGGMKDGKAASETAIGVIRNSFKGMDRNADLSLQLRNSIYAASSSVEQLLEGDGGSTVVAGIIYQEKLHFASVGDSFFYLKRDGLLYRLNQEHTVCNNIMLECIQEGKFDPRPGLEDGESTALSQFLGMRGMERIDGSLRPLNLLPGDVLLACSDGVGGVLNEAEVMHALEREDPREMCVILEQGIVAHNKPHQDNYTAVVVKCCV